MHLLSLPAKRGNLVWIAATVGVALCLLTLLALPKPAYACSCGHSGSPREAMAEADAVFTGRVTAVTVHQDDPRWFSGVDPVTVEFKVRSVWKGPRRKTLTVETARHGASCGFEFKEGREYIVYSYYGSTGLCTRTAPTWMALRDFAVLGSGWKPASISDSAPTAEHVPPPESTPAPRSAGCGATPASDGGPADVAALGLVAGMVLLTASRRRK